MKNIEIRTQYGLKSPSEAFHILRQNDCSVPNKISVLNQLSDLAPLFAHEAAAWVKSQPNLSSENKLQRVSEEILTGLPMGEKRFTTKEGFKKFLMSIPMGSKLKITFANDKIIEMRSVLALDRRYLFFQTDQFIQIWSYVIPSGRWERISRTVNAHLLVDDEVRLEVISSILITCVESIELVYTLEQLAQRLNGVTDTPYQQALRRILEKYSDVDYDPDLFRDTIDDLGYHQALEWGKSFTANEPMEKVLGRFGSDMARVMFLNAYAIKFYDLMGISK